MAFGSDTFQLLVDRVATEMRKQLPTGSVWFSESARDSGTLSQLLSVVQTQVAEWLGTIKDSRDGTFLADASGAALQSWGRDLNKPQKSGESDDAYRARLQGEIVRLRVVREGVQSYIQDLTGLPTTIFLPWKSVAFWDQRNTALADGAPDPVYGYSGIQRYGSGYWQGGVVDIQTEGYAEGIQDLAAQVVAAGIQVYYTAFLDPDSDLEPEQDPPMAEFSFEAESMASPYEDRIVYSTSGYYSGGPVELPEGEVLTTIEALLVAESGLVDEPAAGKSFEVFDSPYLWADLDDLSWDQATAGAWAVPTSDTTVSG